MLCGAAFKNKGVQPLLDAVVDFLPSPLDVPPVEGHHPHTGALEVRKGDVLVNAINLPGALVGEISVLLGTAYSATVAATAPSVLRYAADGHALLAGDPYIGRLVAVGLAERLDFVTTYLADLKHQYGDAPGIAMVSDVLSQLAQRQAPPARPGSARDPDPEY